jgi:hypothetical protein
MAEWVREVTITSGDGTIIGGHITIQEEDSLDPDLIRLSLSFASEELIASADDCFSALLAIRLKLERGGLLLKCYGASRNVYPSGMSRGMGLGDRAYKLAIGRPARNSDIVNIFDIGPDVDAASVEAQRSFFERWISSHDERPR